MLKSILEKFSNKSIRHIGIYTLANFLSRGISFIFLPLFTYYISERGFGILALINNSILFLNALILFSVPVTLTAEYFKLEKDAYKNLFTSLFGYVIISTLATTLLIALFFEPLKENFGFKEYYIVLLPFLTFLNFFTEQLNNFLRIRNESGTFLVVNVLKAALEIGIAFLLLATFRNDYYSRVFSISITSLLLGMYGMYYFFGKMGLYGKFSFRLIRNEIPFGISIFIMQAGIFLMGSSDKFFVKYFYTDDLTGIYNMASTLAAILFILSSSIMSYLTPAIYKTLNGTTGQELITLKRQFLKYSLFILGSGIIVFLGGTFTYYFLIKPTYLVGYPAFCVLLIGNLFWAIGNFFYPVFWHYRTKRKLLTISLFSILLSIPTYYFSIRYYSITGAAFGLLLIYFLISLVIYYQGSRVLQRMIAPRP